MGVGPEGRERRWRGLDRLEVRNRAPRSLFVALLLASITLITLDVSGGDDSPVDPLRQVAGEAFAPAEQGVAAAVRPFTSVPAWFRSKSDLAERVRTLEADNADLREQVATADFDRNRLEQYDGLTTAARDLGQTLVPARVVAIGSRQSFSHTVTIDAGSEAGIGPDMTVVSNEGLVGRVLRVTRTSATVLLITDPESTVGGRVGSSMEIGFVTGNGSLSHRGGLDLRLVDDTVVPSRDETVVTWGGDGGPYAPGVPIGRVTEVYSSVREASQRAVLEPFVDFSALDLVGVVVHGGVESDRSVIEADGGLR
jgi:rod shape-determining protein MreC